MRPRSGVEHGDHGSWYRELGMRGLDLRHRRVERQLPGRGRRWMQPQPPNSISTPLPRLALHRVALSRSATCLGFRPVALGCTANSGIDRVCGWLLGLRVEPPWRLELQTYGLRNRRKKRKPRNLAELFAVKNSGLPRRSAPISRVPEREGQTRDPKFWEGLLRDALRGRAAELAAKILTAPSDVPLA